MWDLIWGGTVHNKELTPLQIKMAVILGLFKSERGGNLEKKMSSLRWKNGNGVDVRRLATGFVQFFGLRRHLRIPNAGTASLCWAACAASPSPSMPRSMMCDRVTLAWAAPCRKLGSLAVIQCKSFLLCSQLMGMQCTAELGPGS